MRLTVCSGIVLDLQRSTSMRIIYIDLDSQRPDHLGCYGYHRNTSPNIDRLAGQGVRFTNCYVPDAPCLPSRSALFSGRAGIRTGVVNHGGVASEMHNEGPSRQFRSELGLTNWMTCLRNTGHHTCAISPFGERHSAWHWYAGMNEIHNTGGGGMEGAEVVYPVVEDWLKRNARRENYFLHVNFWDAHTPYRTPAAYQSRFAGESLPAWYTEEVLRRHRAGSGAHSAREVCGFGDSDWERSLVARFPQQPC
jgi:arylsulfatase A-like enzyme